MNDEAVHHTTFMIDVQGSGSLSNPEKLRMRAALRSMVDQALAFAGISEGARLEDRGDGVLGTLTADVPKARLVGRGVEGLFRALRADETGIRLRMGIHGGEVHEDLWGIAGSDVELPCRLADAEAARGALAAAPGARLAVMVSEPIYDSVVRHGGPYLFPEQFAKVTVEVKETKRTAWLHVPGYSTPPRPRKPAAPEARKKPKARTPRREGDSYVTSFKNTTHHEGIHIGPSYRSDGR